MIMANDKPIFCIAHPRAVSTAFERVFMTRTDDLVCLHEPFGDAFYFGPERMSRRFEDDEQTRIDTGFADSTYKTIFDRIEHERSEHTSQIQVIGYYWTILTTGQGKRVFIKDIIYYLFPPDGKPPQIAPSLIAKKRGIGTDVNERVNGHMSDATNGDTNGDTNGCAKPPFPYGTPSEPGNPTVVPADLLKQFHFTFLIRDPHYSIPSFYRCTIPPLDAVTGFMEFYSDEAGYDEVRRMFDYLVSNGKVGPTIAGKHDHMNGENGEVKTNAEICIIDADDLLDNPAGIIEKYCESVGLRYDPKMLNWDNEEDHDRAKLAFEKWRGWHDDAIGSKDLKPRAHKKAAKSESDYDQEWTRKYGLKGANIIRQTVDKNMDTYLYLKQFALTV